MPRRLVVVRHGQSEQNFAMRRAELGDTSLITQAFRARHSSQHRLTQTGRQQAESAGGWLRDNGLGRFDRGYASTYARAMETAGLLGLDGFDWMLDPLLREREWGEFDGKTWEEREALAAENIRQRKTDPFYWAPPGGESMAQVLLRLRPMLDTLHRECSQKRVIIVCHGEVMWVLRFILERMSVEGWASCRSSEDPGQKIFNCQVLDYSRTDPDTGVEAPYLNWMRSVCPPTCSNDGPGWQPIVRRRYSNAQLLEQVANVPPLFPEAAGY